ncbi:uncharacterized protein LOC142602829 [Balearica regulorum gibbericeps]|uniref:uncharacterized protein LOC142602829 n=1 Tax=Balearica regulorum gibbericeps TaxID=100784 RepID=UPI003F602E6D
MTTSRHSVRHAHDSLHRQRVLSAPPPREEPRALPAPVPAAVAARVKPENVAGENNKLWDLNSGQEERGFVKPGGAKTRQRREVGGCSEPRRSGRGESGSHPARRGGGAGWGAGGGGGGDGTTHRPGPGAAASAELPEPGSGSAGLTNLPRGGRGAGEGEGAAGPAGRGEPRSGGRAAPAPPGGSDTAGGRGGGHGTAEGGPRGRGTRHSRVGGSTARPGGPVRREAARGPAAGWRGTRSSSSFSSSSSSSSSTRNPASHSGGIDRTGSPEPALPLSLPAPACSPGPGGPILPGPAGARSPSPAGRGGGGGRCVGNRSAAGRRTSRPEMFAGWGQRMGGNVPANHPCPPPCPGFLASPNDVLGLACSAATSHQSSCLATAWFGSFWCTTEFWLIVSLRRWPLQGSSTAF